MWNQQKALLSGNEAVALACKHASITLGTGYPGTPSTEILESFSEYGGKAQWSPNEKVALEVGIGVAFSGARALATMKHVGVNVAADPLFTAAYTGVDGALIVVSADDPGMASSQNEQDNRNYAMAAGLPLLEPSDSQEAYDFVFAAVEISERWMIPVLFRMTTRICHSKTIVNFRDRELEPPQPKFLCDVQSRVMIPAFARPAHFRLRKKLAEIAEWNNTSHLNQVIEGEQNAGIITSGVSFAHVRDAAPEAPVLKLGMAYPFPLALIRSFVERVETCRVIEEGDPFLYNGLRAEGIEVKGKPESCRFGELNVNRVRRILFEEDSPELVAPKGKPPELCQGCPHRDVFHILNELDCIVAGDIGCYTLGVLPPYQAMDTCVCMGASIGVGLGLRHALPDDEARRVVSVIGDSTFVHSGITGLVEMVYNPPKTGHVVLILDNGTTAMTGMQEHPGTGRRLNHAPAQQVSFEKLAEAIGISNIHTLNPTREQDRLHQLIIEAMNLDELTLIVARRPCVLAAGKIRQYEKANAETYTCKNGRLGS